MAMLPRFARPSHKVKDQMMSIIITPFQLGLENRTGVLNVPSVEVITVDLPYFKALISPCFASLVK